MKQTPAQRGGLSSALVPQEGRSDTRRGPGKGAGRRPPGGRSRSRGQARGQGHGWSLQPHPRLPAGASATSPWVPARRPGDLSRGHDGPQEEATAPAGAVTQERPTVAQGRHKVGSPCTPRDSQESSSTPQFKRINSLALSFLHNPTLTSIHNH